MITDVQMNSTVRGAVEVFNLAENLRNGDCLFAEFIRTFSTRSVGTREWFHRLDIELQETDKGSYTCLAPETKKPHKRIARSTAIFVDGYGCRLCESLLPFSVHTNSLCTGTWILFCHLSTTKIKSCLCAVFGRM